MPISKFRYQNLPDGISSLIREDNSDIKKCLFVVNRNH